MWYGPRTPLLSALIDEGLRRGIAVSIQPRQHSLRQIAAAVDAIWQQQAEGQWAGFAISTIAAVGAVDDGITVNGTYTTVAATERAPQVRALSTTVLGVPVRVVPGVSATMTTGRDNDYAPFNAGGYMISRSTGHTCSSGFGISINGTRHITTARHCVYNDYRDRAASNTYGTGTINSGEHCGIKVTNLSVSFNDGYGSFSTIQGVQQNSGAIANMQGDSGGPVISLTNTSSGQVRAAGMIQGFTGTGMTGSACGPAYDYGSNLCSTNVLFSSMRTVVNSISGGSLLTG